MLFNSQIFLLFIAVVLPVYYALPHRLQNYFLLAASGFFYASWDWRFLAPLLTTTTIDFFCALRMSELSGVASAEGVRRKLLATSDAANIGLLGLFKYFDFFSLSLQRLLSHTGLSVHLASLHLILPLGISFYSFQALSYTIDVYRGDTPATRHYLDFLLSVLYFPHLVAGPIQRSRSLLPQIENPRQITSQKILRRTSPDCLGLLQKSLFVRRHRAHGRCDLPVPSKRFPNAPRRLCFRASDLLRLLGIHGHRAGTRQTHGLRVHAELRPAVLLHQSEGVLESLAHQPVHLVSRLLLHSLGRK